MRQRNISDSDVSHIIVAISHNTRCNDQTRKKKKHSPQEFRQVCYITTLSANLSIVAFAPCCKSQKTPQASVKTVLQNQSLEFPLPFLDAILQNDEDPATERGIQATLGIG